MSIKTQCRTFWTASNRYISVICLSTLDPPKNHRLEWWTEHSILSVAFWILKGHNGGNTKTKTTSNGVVSSGSLNQIECKSKEQLHYHSSTDRPTCQNWRFVLPLSHRARQLRRTSFMRGFSFLNPISTKLEVNRVK